MTRFKRKKESAFDEPIEKLREKLLVYSPDDPEYKQIFDHFVKLIELRREEIRTDKVKPDTMVAVAGNLLGILIIVGYERMHVMSSKGLNFLRPNSA